MPLFGVFRAFLAGFRVVVWVCVTRVLCVACVAFCARVELGGLKACGVLPPFFVLLSFCPSLLAFFPLLVLFGCFAFSLGAAGVAFSLSDYTQKERALRVGASSLVLLSVLTFFLPFGFILYHWQNLK